MAPHVRTAAKKSKAGSLGVLDTLTSNNSSQGQAGPSGRASQPSRSSDLASIPSDSCGPGSDSDACGPDSETESCQEQLPLQKKKAKSGGSAAAAAVKSRGNTKASRKAAAKLKDAGVRKKSGGRAREPKPQVVLNETGTGKRLFAQLAHETFPPGLDRTISCALRYVFMPGHSHRWGDGRVPEEALTRLAKLNLQQATVRFRALVLSKRPLSNRPGFFELTTLKEMLAIVKDKKYEDLDAFELMLLIES